MILHLFALAAALPLGIAELASYQNGITSTARQKSVTKLIGLAVVLLYLLVKW